MNKQSKIVYQMMKYYFGNHKNLVNDYLRYGIKYLQNETVSLNTCAKLKPQFKPLNIKQQKEVFRGHTEKTDSDVAKTVKWAKKIRTQVLAKLDDKDFVVRLPEKSIYRPLEKDDLILVRNNLDNYLFTHTNTKYQIKWILKHKTVSDNTFAKVVNMKVSQITQYKNGKKELGKMTLDQALNLKHYYMLFVGRRLIGDYDSPDRWAIKEAKNDTINDIG